MKNHSLGKPLVIAALPVSVALLSCASQDTRPSDAALSGYERTTQAEAKNRQVSGTVVNTKTVEVRGSETKNLVVMIKTNKGDRRLVVDLGPVGTIDEALVQPGKELAAEGRIVRVRDQQFLVATRAKLGDMLVNISRAGT